MASQACETRRFESCVISERYKTYGEGGARSC